MTDAFTFTNLDAPLFPEADASKGDLVGYLDAVRDRLIPDLRNRPLSVVRAVRGQPPFMQKNVPKYTPSWVRRVTIWADASRRDVSYALCNDRRTLLWLANQRAVELHPALVRAGVPVSFPLEWDELGQVAPTDFTIHTAAQMASERPPWTSLLPRPQRLPARLVDAGRAIPLGRLQAMHEGRRRARATRDTR